MWHTSCPYCERPSVPSANPPGSRATASALSQTANTGRKKTRYAPDSGRLLPAHREFGWFTRQEKPPETTRDICTSLLQAVQANLKDEAMRCLTASLADGLSFEDLKEFFGDYLVWTPSISPACGPDSFALKYSTQKGLYTAREFCVETKTVQDALRIDNIREP